MKHKITIDLPYKPHMGQALVHKSNARFKCIACGRRWGKTHSALMELLISSLRTRGRFWWIAPIYKELTPVSNILYEIIRESPDLVKDIRVSKKVILYLGLLNGSKIWFHSADRSNSLRGEGLDGVVIDEAAFIKRETWEAEIRPALMDKKGWAIFISTPNGRNWFYEQYLKGQDRETWPEWESWSFSSYQNTKQNGGFLDKEEIDATASSLPELIRRQEIYAEFLEGEGTVFRKIDSCRSGSLGRPLTGREYFIGVDLGKTEDYTVLVAINDRGHIRGFQRFRQLDWTFQKEKIKAFANRFEGLIWIDATGVGDPIYESLRNDSLKVIPYTFTNKTKRALVMNLSIGFDEGRYTIPLDPEVDQLVNELKAFTYTLTPSRHIKYGAPEGYHDDCVYALALAAWGHKDWRPPPRGPVSYFGPNV